jgi:hypothetical protein
MTTDKNNPGAENDPPELRRVYGLLISEWVTYGMIVVVVAGVIFGFRVGAERDAQAERAMATLDALTAEAERVVASGGILVCDDRLLDPGQLANDYLALSIRPAPIDEDDASLGSGPALYVDVVEEEVSGDTWDTAGRLMALVKEAASEEAEAEAREAPAATVDEDADGESEEPKNRLRNVRKTTLLEDEEYLRYLILASESARCSEDA